MLFITTDIDDQGDMIHNSAKLALETGHSGSEEQVQLVDETSTAKEQDLEKFESVEEGGRLSLAAEESVLSKGGHPSGRK